MVYSHPSRRERPVAAAWNVCGTFGGFASFWDMDRAAAAHAH